MKKKKKKKNDVAGGGDLSSPDGLKTKFKKILNLLSADVARTRIIKKYQL